jgi:Cys-rich repeat protein
MTKNELRWLMVALAATPILFPACGGDDTNAGGGTTGTTTGAAGSGTGGAAGSGTGGAATGTGGGTRDSSVPDGRIPCGTVANGCNPNGRASICDEANNRCVQCLADTNCTFDATLPLCNVTTGRCVQCLNNTQCTGGMICSAGNDCVSTCTTDANCSDGGASQNPYCNTTATPAICVECLTDPHCAPTGADGGFNRPFCTNNQCVQCRTNADCVAPATCNVNVGFCGGGGGGMTDAARGG